MTWNYRVISHVWDDGSVSYGIHEVYYDGKNPHSWTASPITGYYEDREELKQSLFLMLDAFYKPVLDEEALKERVAKKGEKDA